MAAPQPLSPSLASSFLCFLVLSSRVTWLPPERHRLGSKLGRSGYAPTQSHLGCQEKSHALGGPPTYTQSQLSWFHPQKNTACHRLGEKFILPLFQSPSHSTRKILLFGFKNRTLELDFYGLVKKLSRAHPHLVSAPAWPRPAAQKQLCTSSLGPSVDLRARPWLRPSPHGSRPQSSCSPTSSAASARTSCVSVPAPTPTC